MYDYATLNRELGANTLKGVFGVTTRKHDDKVVLWRRLLNINEEENTYSDGWEAVEVEDDYISLYRKMFLNGGADILDDMEAQGLLNCDF